MAEIMFPLENTDYSAADAQLWFATRLSGVYANNHLAVSAAGGMGVNIGKGIAWLHYGEFAGAVYGNTGEINLPIPLADATYPRIDRVVIRYDAVQNKGFLTISPGTPASNPAPAALLRNENAYEISLAQVYVAAGVTQIFDENITDERLDESVCGLMRDGVTGIDTSVIHAQFTDMLSRISSSADSTLKAVEEGSASRLGTLEKDANDLIALLNTAYENAISGTIAGDLQQRVRTLESYPRVTSFNVPTAQHNNGTTDLTPPYTFPLTVDNVGANDVIDVRVDYDSALILEDKATYREAMRNAVISVDSMVDMGEGSYTIYLVCDGEFPTSITNMVFKIINYGAGVTA